MVKRKIIYSVLTLVFLIFFIYIFFPTSLIKEVLVSQVQQNLDKMNTGLVIKVDSMSSYWFSGVKLENVQIYEKGNQNKSQVLTLDSLAVRVSILPIIIGHLNINSKIEIADGESDIGVSLGLFDLLGGKTKINSIESEFDSFPLDQFYSQLIGIIINSPNPSLSLIVPVLQNSSFGGFLNGEIDFRNKEHYLSKINLSIKNGYLDIKNAALGIPKQNFTQAQVNVELVDSNIRVLQNTAFLAQNLSISTTGNITAINKKSKLNLKLQIKMSGQIEKNFSFLIPQMLKCPSSVMMGGLMNVQLIGSTSSFTCSL